MGAASPTAAPGLYIHVPFCARVCPYCDFAVQTGGVEKRSAYQRALLREIRSWGVGERRWSAAEPFDTVYLGGGTPSSLAPETLAEIITALNAELAVSAAAEITLEANPEDVDDRAVATWRELGVSRVSLGVQSFDDQALEVLGRTHTAEQAGAAVERLLAAGIPSVSLDVIFAVPGQSAAGWEATLQRAVDLRPHHISCYELTVHAGTRFFKERARGRFVETSDDHKAEQFFITHRFLADAGYPAYEVSNFARAPQHRSRHNTKYWRHAPYLGLGPSAHSYDGARRRWWNEPRLVGWKLALDEADSSVCEEEVLSSEQIALEALALGLRTVDGVDLDRIARTTGIDLQDTNLDVIGTLVGEGMLEPVSGARLAPTLAGLAVADAMARSFEIPAPAGVGTGEEATAESVHSGAARSGGAA